MSATIPSWVIKVTKPPVQGQRVKGLQWLFLGHNPFGYQTYHGKIDGIFGPVTGEAAKQMKYKLGYPDGAVVPTAGSTLRAYLLPPGAPGYLSLPNAYRVRADSRRRLTCYPLAKPGTIIGRPGQGTHSYTTPPNNWESDHAVDIAADMGTHVLACFHGTIGDQFGPLDSKNPALAGLRLHVLGAHDEAYYAHLSRFAPGLAPGKTVAAGDLLGFSGVANGVGHLHFALKSASPVQFLTDALKGAV